MMKKLDIICIGSVLWDVIGRSSVKMNLAADRPGKIIRIPGGVALNLAMSLQKNGFNSLILSAIGKDQEGDQLIEQLKLRGIITDYIYRTKDFPTDSYMAIEGSNGLIGAIADTHTLERSEENILLPLRNGTLGDIKEPWRGLIALDGNLTETLLNKINFDPIFKNADLRIAPASPGKASRLRRCLNGNVGTVYVNLEEANLILNENHKNSKLAAQALTNIGVRRAIVTNGKKPVTVSEKNSLISLTPPIVNITRVTGAGDVFMASHIQAEMVGKKNESAIRSALNQTAKYISSSEML
jgi:pseudouridine kinase